MSVLIPAIECGGQFFERLCGSKKLFPFLAASYVLRDVADFLGMLPVSLGRRLTACHLRAPFNDVDVVRVLSWASLAGGDASPTAPAVFLQRRWILCLAFNHGVMERLRELRKLVFGGIV